MKVTLEYRGTICEPLSFLDKETGKPVNTQRVIHSCETPEGEQVRISDPNGKTLDLATYKAPYKKGQLIEVELRLDPSKPMACKSINTTKDK